MITGIVTNNKNDQIQTLETSLTGLLVIFISYSFLISIHFSGDNNKSILFASKWKKKNVRQLNTKFQHIIVKKDS